MGEKLDKDAEMAFLAKIFESDTKNFHAWSYRVWLVERFQLWQGELDFCNKLMDEDIYNNSLWSYRYFLLSRSPAGTYSGVTGTPGSPEFVAKELDILMNHRIPQKVDNEASWVYLRGLLCTTQEEEDESSKKKIKRVFMGRFKAQLEPFLATQAETARQDPRQRGLRFILQCQSDMALADGDPAAATKLMEELRDSADRIRSNYWQWKINRLQSQE